MGPREVVPKGPKHKRLHIELATLSPHSQLGHVTGAIARLRETPKMLHRQLTSAKSMINDSSVAQSDVGGRHRNVVPLPQASPPNNVDAPACHPDIIPVSVLLSASVRIGRRTSMLTGVPDVWTPRSLQTFLWEFPGEEALHPLEPLGTFGFLNEASLAFIDAMVTGQSIFAARSAIPARPDAAASEVAARTIADQAPKPAAMSQNSRKRQREPEEDTATKGRKVYVKQACTTCKASHVACDADRPCQRCVRLGRAETCTNAERKKRGRPSQG